MRIAVVNETSAADRNADIIKALEGRGHEVINAGMTKNGQPPELSYIQTGLISAILLNLKRVDFVVGGCGTGQGYLNSVMQYPGVSCGHVLDSMDAWLFARINAGNCISLALNQGYGWAANENLRLIFDQLFASEFGTGYPPHRAAPQAEYRGILKEVSVATHKSLAEIIRALPDEILMPALNYPGIRELIGVPGIEDVELRAAFEERYARGGA